MAHNTPNKTLQDEKMTSRSTVRKRPNIWIPFLISPFITLLYGLKNYRQPWAKNTVWLFVVFFGMTLTVISDGPDINRHISQLENFHQFKISWDTFYASIYSDTPNPATGRVYLDVYQPLLTYLVSFFTANFHVLYTFVGLVFGYFYSRNIWFLIDNAGVKIKKENLILVLTFAFIVSFSSMQSIRMWTAAHVFFFGGFLYLFYNNKKGLWIALLAPLIHFSYLFALVPLAVFYLLRSRLHLYFGFYAATFFIGEIEMGVIRETLMSILPDIFHGRIEAYAGDPSGEEGAGDGRRWYAQYYGMALRITIFAFVTIMYFEGRKFIAANPALLALFSFALLFFGAANVMDLVSSGGRFYSVASLFGMASIFLYLQHAPREKLMRRLLPFAYPALALYVIVAVRIAFDWISVMTILGNPVLRLFGNIDIALIELIR